MALIQEHQMHCQFQLQLLHYWALLWELMIVNQLVAEADCMADCHTDRID